MATENTPMLTPVEQEERAFHLAQRQAKVYTSSTIVPDTYRGDANIGNAIIALDIAKRINANPLMVMQNLYVVYGNPSWSSKFLIATINNCGRFTPLRYEFCGEEGKASWGCRCYAYERNDSNHEEKLLGTWVTLDMAQREGWTKKSGSKWLTMPQQMLMYRAAAFWQRTYAPEISMGLLTADEQEDIHPEEQRRVENIEEVPFEELTPAGKVQAAMARNSAKQAAQDVNAPADAQQTTENANNA